ncbi:MAG: hypothetical protein IH984_13365 [Planctomycetes bacterium]|nr:hypothetical protein [Planctomycetota bacterium]
MNKNVLSVVAALVVSSSVSAGLVEVNWQVSPFQHPDGQHITYQIYASFDNLGDQMGAVNGLEIAGLNTLDFWTIAGVDGVPGSGGDIYNQEAFIGLPFNDFPSINLHPLAEAYDSYVTIGQTEFPANTLFSPDFLGDWGKAPPPVQVILGSAFSESDGAWFFFGAPPTVGDLPDTVAGNATHDVLIAQFTVAAGNNVHLNANVAWFDALGGSNNTPFSIETPAPGALALLGLAGLAGIRRRRR